MPDFPSESPDYILREKLILRLIGDRRIERPDTQHLIEDAEALAKYIKQGPPWVRP